MTMIVESRCAAQAFGWQLHLDRDMVLIQEMNQAMAFDQVLDLKLLGTAGWNRDIKRLTKIFIGVSLTLNESLSSFDSS